MSSGSRNLRTRSTRDRDVRGRQSQSLPRGIRDWTGFQTCVLRRSREQPASMIQQYVPGGSTSRRRFVVLGNGGDSSGAQLDVLEVGGAACPDPVGLRRSGDAHENDARASNAFIDVGREEGDSCFSSSQRPRRGQVRMSAVSQGPRAATLVLRESGERSRVRSARS